MAPAGKIVVACLPLPLLILSIAVVYTTSRKIELYPVWSMFSGLNDVFSDWTLLVLIEVSNPWGIFWLALISLVLSTVVSITIGCWFAKKYDQNPAILVWYCVTSSTEQLKSEADFDDVASRLSKINTRTALLLEALPMFVVQIILYCTTSSSGTQIIDMIIVLEVSSSYSVW
jgi:hypothetical protein